MNTDTTNLISTRNIEVHFIDSINNIKHKTFVTIEYDYNTNLSQYLQFIHIQVVIRNVPINKRITVSHSNFNMQLVRKKQNTIRYAINCILNQYCSFQLPPMLNDLIFKFYDNKNQLKHIIQSKQYFGTLFWTINEYEQTGLLPLKILNKIKNWLANPNIVQREMDKITKSPCSQNNRYLSYYDYDDNECDDWSLPLFVRQPHDDLCNCCGCCCLMCYKYGWGMQLTNKFKYKGNKSKYLSKKSRNSWTFERKKYSKKKKCKKYKHSYVNIGDLKYKIKSRKYIELKRPKKEYEMKQYKRMSKQIRDSKRNNYVAPNCIVEITEYDRNDFSMTYWVPQDYNFV
eukprot:340453_1